MPGRTPNNPNDIRSELGGLMQSVLDSDPRLRGAFEEFQRTGQVAISTVDPILRDAVRTIRNGIDMLDGEENNNVTRAALAQTAEQIRNVGRRHAGNAEALNRIESGFNLVRERLSQIPESIPLPQTDPMVSQFLNMADADRNGFLNQAELTTVMDKLRGAVNGFVGASPADEPAHGVISARPALPGEDGVPIPSIPGPGR